MRFEVYPKQPIPGTTLETAREQWVRDLKGAHLYIVWVGPPMVPDWDPEIRALLSHLRPVWPRLVLPLIESPANVDSLPEFARNLVPLRISSFARSRREIEAAIDALFSSRQVPQQTDRGTVGYIANITLSNFRAFREPQTLDLRSSLTPSTRWTVILGDNGTGKTTLLRAIAARCAGAPESWLKSATDCSISVVRDFEGTEVLEDGRPTCFGYGAGRRAKPASHSAEATGISATLFADHVDLPDAEEWILQSDHSRYVEGGDAPAAKHFEQVKEVLKELLPDVEDIKVESADHRTRVMVQMHGEWFHMSAMSLGYKTALTWIVDLARRMFERFPDSEEPLKKPAVVLVDEIDLHLHPKWQRSLLRVLDETFPRVQFIVTAHSPLIVQAAPHANLVLLRREGDRIVIDNDLDYIRDWRVDQILASELFDEQPVHSPRVQQLLKERAELLEAGPPIDNDRLRKIDEELDELPTAAMPEDQKAMDLIRRAAKLIESK